MKFIWEIWAYFWQIQDREVWPVYYTNAVQTMTDLNIWQPTEDIAQDYLAFKQIHEALAKLFSETSKRPFGLYDVEHVFWFKGGNPYDAVKAEDKRPNLQWSNLLENFLYLPTKAICLRVTFHR